MLKDRRFQVWLVIFAVVAIPLVALLWPRSPHHPSIGGGSYDLSGFVYTLCLLAFSGLWSLIALLTAFSRDNAWAARRAYWLAGVSATTFVAALIAFGDNL
ncbi:hypothetical protein [Corticimicrobacter populi]|uniref:Uncharacterized protein n=1 Tax=Corticimicrobacter populi TaxID=2175229 RepID=A0A2V1K2N4_9BURK|nr:hypothetical protein [Corticimicrobacter populi]PWF24830.1 hypothetical protein DD235_01190 [Corticimicrobacter populi]